MTNTLQINTLERKPEPGQNIKNARRNAKQICRRKKRQFEENLLYDLEENWTK